MNDSKASYRQILKSTSIVGGATVASLVFGLARSKAIALLAGPSGIGLFGVLNTLFNTGTAVAGLNLWASGVRQVGTTPVGSTDRARAETGLWLFTWLAAIIGSVGFWLFEHFYYVPNTPGLADGPAFPWIAVAVGISTLNGAQLIILQVYGRIGAIAFVRLIGSFLSALLGVTAVFLLGSTGLYVAVLATPLAASVVAFGYLRNTAQFEWQPIGRWILAMWRGLAVMGFGLTIAGLTSNVSQLALRSVIATRADMAVVGLFQAAWTLSNVNLTVVLSAMAVDYFPRLTAKATSPVAVAEILNQQLHVALLIAAPILTLAIGFAPLLLQLLYSDSFLPATSVLQWQIVGDVLKLASWCLGFVLLALNATASYIAAGLMFDVTIVLLVWLLYPLLGLESAGISYIAAMALSLLISIFLARRRGIIINRRNGMWMAVLFAALLGLLLISTQSVFIGMGAGVAASALSIGFAWQEARRMDLPLPAPFRRLLKNKVSAGHSDP